MDKIIDSLDYRGRKILKKKSGKKSKKERKFANLKITWRQPDAGQKSNFEVRYVSNNRENEKNVRFQAKKDLHNVFSSHLTRFFDAMESVSANRL